MGNTQQENKKWWQSKKMIRKDYGRVALLGLLLAGLKSIMQFGGLLAALIDISIIIGIVCGIMWLVETRKLKQKNTK